jgi:hypothetical protein
MTRQGPFVYGPVASGVAIPPLVVEIGAKVATSQPSPKLAVPA